MISREVDAWLTEVERGIGKRPVVYVTPKAYELFIRGRAVSHPLWVRNVLREPRLDAADAWSIWQFWPRGRVAGIAGPADLNALRGGLEALGGTRARERASPQGGPSG